MALNRVALGLLAAVLTASAQETAGPVLSAPANLNFASGVVGRTPDGWVVPPTRVAAGFSAELRREGCHSGIGCAVLAPPPNPPLGRDAVLWQRFNAASYRGATVRVRGWVRLDTADPASRVQMWFRVDRANSQRGFYDGMEDRPVRSTEWQLCEIVGKVAEDAEYLGVAVTSVGKARAWVDDVTIELVDSRTPLTAPEPAKETLVVSVNSQPENLDFRQGDEGHAPPGWSVPLTLARLGYSAELRRQGCHSHAGCAVLLVPAIQTNKDRFGNLMQRFSAQRYHGHTIRLRAWVRVDTVDPDDRAQMWIRVDRSDQKVGFFDNMDNRPVRSPQWQPVEIVGRIDYDADYINIGLMSIGKGSAWIDGVTIEDIDTPASRGVIVKHLGPVVSGPTNLSFAVGEPGKVPPGWSVPNQDYSAEVRRDGCWSGHACVVVLMSANPARRSGAMTETFSGLPYRGKNFRLRARLRVEAKGPQDAAQMALRVDRPNSEIDVSDRTIRTDEWTYREITGRIADDAEYVNISFVSIGKGNAWVDDVAFEILPDAKR